MNFHKTVLLKESIEALNIKPTLRYIDGTLGGGGHAKAILEKGGQVLAIDLDQDAISHVSKLLAKPQNLKTVQGNFRNIDKIAKSEGFDKVSGIILDLGVSSHQIDDEARGFSYQKDSALDMRMDRKGAVKALDLLNLLSKNELYEIFTKFGEEPNSRAISNRIIESRRVKAFATTRDLTKIIEEAYGVRGEIDMKKRAQLNNRVFQALRIAVNDEINSLIEVLPKAISLLLPSGRLAVISFHSMEDRIVKESFLRMEKDGLGTVITKKPIIPTDLEMAENRRSKSAKLRVFEKV